MNAESFAPLAGKQYCFITALRFPQPRFQYGECGFGDGCTALFALMQIFA